jgi:hypothetical protein
MMITDSKTSPIASFLILSLVAGCVHPGVSVDDQLAAADNKCHAPSFVSASDKIGCFSQNEVPIIEREAPFALAAYSVFDDKRMAAAAELDRDAAPALAAWKGFADGVNQAAAVLVAREPDFGNQNGKLRKDISGASPETVCRQSLLVERMTCFSEITRPIWQRDAPNTMPYYDKFQAKRIQFAQNYDTLIASTGTMVLIDRYQERIKGALREFRAAAVRAAQIARQQAAAQQEAERARAAEAADRLANFIGEMAEGALTAAAMAAAARADVSPSPAPINCTSNSIGNYTYTHCY